MGDFRPGVDAARKALGNSIPIVHKPHPGGSAGVRLSLQEVAARIKKGRNDPRVRSWAIRALHEAGGPQDSRTQAEVLLAALKKAAVYVQDPVNTEFIQAAHETLCLDDKGFCFRGGDCDDLSVAYGSATLSIGIPTKIVGECFNNNPVPSHVLCAIQDTATGEWLHVDPSTNKPVGQYVQGTKEEWIDPMAPLNGQLASGNDAGDFVGVGKVHHGLADIVSTPIAAQNTTSWLVSSLAITAIAGLAYTVRRGKRF